MCLRKQTEGEFAGGQRRLPPQLSAQPGTALRPLAGPRSQQRLQGQIHPLDPALPRQALTAGQRLLDLVPLFRQPPLHFGRRRRMPFRTIPQLPQQLPHPAQLLP